MGRQRGRPATVPRSGRAGATALSVVAVGNPMVNVFATDTSGALHRAGVRPGMALLAEPEDWQRAAASVRPILVEPGGTSFTTMMAVATALPGVEFWGRAADDANGRLIARAARSRGVLWDASPAVRGGGPERTARCLVVVAEDGERALLTDLGAAADGPARMPAPAQAAVLLTEVYQWDSDRHERVFGWFAQSPADHRLLTLSDVRAVRAHRERLLELVRRVPCTLVGSRLEVAAWAGCDPADAELTERVRSLVRASAGAGSTGVVMTDGPRDAIWADAETTVRVPAPRAPAVADLTGAGDLFCAGFVLGLVHGRDRLEQLRWGHLLAAAAIARRGTLHVDARHLLGL